MKKNTVKIISLLVFVSLLLCSCSKKNYSAKVTVDTHPATQQTGTNAPVVVPTVKEPTYTIDSSYDRYFTPGVNIVELGVESDTPVAVMKIADKGYVTIILYPQNAPNTVNNFVSRIVNGEYDGFAFTGFDSTFGLVASAENEEYTLAKETVAAPLIRYSEYIVFMNKDIQTGNTSGSSFFICLDEFYQNDFESLLFKDYVGIGEVMDGVDVLKSIALKSRGASAEFDEPLTIEQVVVDLNGYTVTEIAKIK